MLDKDIKKINNQIKIIDCGGSFAGTKWGEVEFKCFMCKCYYEANCIRSEFGSKSYTQFLVKINKPICDRCAIIYPKCIYDPKQDSCKTCKLNFLSRNELFRHLKEMNHFI